MSDNTSDEMNKKGLAQSNMWTAIVLGVIALIVAIMPFFYLANSAVK